jgi:hypothetical protein
MSKKKSKPAAGVEAVATMSERESKHYREIRSLESTCDRLEGEYEAAKAAASAAKSLWSEAVSRLRESIRRGPDPQLGLPLADDFRSAEIGFALTLTKRQAEILEEAGIVTVQDYENVRWGKDKRFPNGLADVPGVGQALIEKWEEELLDYIAGQQQIADDTADAGGELDDDQDDEEGDA